MTHDAFHIMTKILHIFPRLGGDMIQTKKSAGGEGNFA